MRADEATGEQATGGQGGSGIEGKRYIGAEAAVSADGTRAVCPNCGAEFSIDSPRCPYCSTLNPVGAEKEYMGALDDLKRETDDLDDNAAAGFKANLKGNAKRTVAVIVIVVAVLAAAFLIINCSAKSDEQRELREYQARETFREQYFEEFDRLYDAGDYDALSNYVWSLSEEPGFDAFFSWKHVGFLEAHDYSESIRLVEQLIESGDCTLDDYTWAVSDALHLSKLDGGGGYGNTELSPADEELVAGYRAHAREFLHNVLQMNDDEIIAFADEAKDDLGYIQDDELRSNLEQRLKQLGTPYRNA